MHTFRALFGRLDDAVSTVEDLFIIALHGGIAVMVIVAVALRYVFNNPLTWGEELIVALLTWIIRTFGAYPDGIAFAVLLMNIAAPLIDMNTQPPVFGHKGGTGGKT